MHPNGLFGPDDHPGQPGRHGDPLEVPERTVDSEHFRGWLVDGPGYGNGSRGGRAPFDPVSMFRALILQAQHNPSDARMQLMIRDRLSWMRFPDLEPGGPTPDGNATRHFRNRLTGTGRLRRVMKAIDRQLRKKGCIPMSGRTVGASLVPAPKRHVFADGGYSGPKPRRALDRIGQWTIGTVRRSDAAMGPWGPASAVGRGANPRMARRLARDRAKSIAFAEAWINVAHISLTARRLARYCNV